MSPILLIINLKNHSVFTHQILKFFEESLTGKPVNFIVKKIIFNFTLIFRRE